MYKNLNDVLVKAIEKAGGYIDKGIDLAIELCKERGGLPEYKSTILAMWFECKESSRP